MANDKKPKAEKFNDHFMQIPAFVRRCLTYLDLDSEQSFAHLANNELDDKFFETLGNVMEMGIAGKIRIYSKEKKDKKDAIYHVNQMKLAGLPIITLGMKSLIRGVYYHSKLQLPK